MVYPQSRFTLPHIAPPPISVMLSLLLSLSLFLKLFLSLTLTHAHFLSLSPSLPFSISLYSNCLFFSPVPSLAFFFSQFHTCTLSPSIFFSLYLNLSLSHFYFLCVFLWLIFRLVGNAEQWRECACFSFEFEKNKNTHTACLEGEDEFMVALLSFLFQAVLTDILYHSQTAFLKIIFFFFFEEKCCSFFKTKLTR